MEKQRLIFQDVQVGDPQRHANIAIYPLSVPNGHHPQYRTLDDALEKQVFTVTEVSESGQVPNLRVKNTGELPVLLVTGEELIGAKQNRILNTTVLVPATSELDIPVTCVERGRWAYNQRAFSSGNTTGHLHLRKSQTEYVTQNLRSSQVFASNQHAVWQEVDRKISSHDARSSTSALHDVYRQTESTVQDYLSALNVPDAQGFVVTINGTVMGADLFDHADTLKHLWNKLIRGYVLDAIEKQNETRLDESRENVQQFLQQAQTATVEPYPSVGLGQDWRLSSKTVQGSSLVWETRPVHTSVFNAQL